MTAHDAARKIRSLGGEVTKIVLIRYGVSEEDAKSYFRWVNGRKGQKAQKFFRRRDKKKKPIIFFGHNTAPGR